MSRPWKNQDGLSTIAVILLAGLGAVFTGVVLMNVMVVHVKTPEPEAHNLVIPIPMILGDIALQFLPDDLGEDAIIPPEFREKREMILQVMDSLLSCPDAELVRVDSDETEICMRVEKGLLLLDVNAPDAKVVCRLPIKGIRNAFQKWDFEKVDSSFMSGLLHAVEGDLLVEVHAEDGTEVKISRW